MSASDLVARYRALPFPSGGLGDCAENYLKCQIVSALVSHANDPEVLQLLVEILREPGEFDLARMDAAKIVALDIDGQTAAGRELKGQLWKIVGNRQENLLVRQQAAQCLELGYGGEAETELVERILFDEADDLDVRHGVLAYLGDRRAESLAKRLVPRLREHPYWSQFEQALDKMER